MSALPRKSSSEDDFVVVVAEGPIVDDPDWITVDAIPEDEDFVLVSLPSEQIDVEAEASLDKSLCLSLGIQENAEAVKMANIEHIASVISRQEQELLALRAEVEHLKRELALADKMTELLKAMLVQ